MTELIGIPVGVLAPSALAGLAVLFVLTGLLVPRRTYNDKAHDASEWRTEARLKDAQLAEKDAQLAEKDVQLRHMGEVGTTMKAVLSALQRLSNEGGGQ